MTKITITKNGFTAVGHADYAEPGKDIVCSAISAITQTTAIGLVEYCKAEWLVESGVVITKTETPNMVSEALLYSMYMGLKEIQKEYPSYLQIKGEV